MKNYYYLTALFLFALSGKAQKLNPGPVVAGLESDINYLATGYLSPLGDAVGSAMNNGWYQTAETKKPGRFEIGISPMVIFAPQKATTFAIQESRLSELELVNPNQNITPTAFGADEPGAELKYTTNFAGILQQEEQFHMPGGYGFSFLPQLTMQAGVGLWYDTDLKIRYMPQVGVIGLEDTRINMWGFGVNHNFKQWIPGLKNLPFDASLFFGYTSFDFEQDFNSEGEDTRLTLSTQTYTTRLLISKEILFLTFYGGIGYNSGETRIQLKGTYRYINPLDLNNPEQEIKDPVDFTTNGMDGVAGNLGLRLKFLWVVYFSADYTFGPYDALTTGLGASIDF